MSIYDEDFFRNQMDRSLQAAEVIVPRLLQLFEPRSVIDVGCGVGGWLAVFREHGVERIHGIDGDYVDRSMLRIPEADFSPQDLSIPVEFGRFDLAVSLEVAEHLAPEGGEALLDTLVGSADVVVFSAAVPDQGGHGHVNERWPSHWASRFAERGFLAVDCIRPAIWEATSVPYYYRQNMLVFCRPSRVPEGFQTLAPEDRFALDRICPDFYEARSRLLGAYMPPPRSLRATAGAIRWAMASLLRGEKQR